jgi:hypothetical protein
MITKQARSCPSCQQGFASRGYQLAGWYLPAQPEPASRNHNTRPSTRRC